MNNGMISSRYATALLAFAAERKLEKHFYEMANQFTRSATEQPRLKTALESPVLDGQQKKQLILSASGVKNDENFGKFVQLIVDNNRAAFMHFIMLKYMDLYREKNQIFSGKLITAAPIDAQTEKRLISVIERRKKGTLEVHKEINTALLGGFILEVDNTRWDASVQSQLRKIRNELITKK